MIKAVGSMKVFVPGIELCGVTGRSPVVLPEYTPLLAVGISVSHGCWHASADLTDEGLDTREVYVGSFNKWVTTSFAENIFYKTLQSLLTIPWFLLPTQPSQWAGITQPVYQLATGWVVGESNSSDGDIFRTRPDHFWGPPSLLCNGAAGAWR